VLCSHSLHDDRNCHRFHPKCQAPWQQGALAATGRPPIPSGPPSPQQFPTSVLRPTNAHLHCACHGWTTSHGLPSSGPWTGPPCRSMALNPTQHAPAFKSLRAPTKQEGSQGVWNNALLAALLTPSHLPSSTSTAIMHPPPLPPTHPANSENSSFPDALAEFYLPPSPPPQHDTSCDEQGRPESHQSISTFATADRPRRTRPVPRNRHLQPVTRHCQRAHPPPRSALAPWPE
jgi:hypothetical protein